MTMQYPSLLALAVSLSASGCSLLFTPEDLPAPGQDQDRAAGPDGGLLEGARVFITSEAFGGAFARGTNARHAANLKCNTAAGEAGLEGIFAAWLSEEGDGALSNIHGSGPWLLVGSGELVFEDHDQLTNNPNTRINRNEFGNMLSRSDVWTGTQVGGAPDNDACSDWSSDYYICPNGDCYYEALVGQSDSNDEDWTESETIDCDQLARLYCFQVDHL